MHLTVAEEVVVTNLEQHVGMCIATRRDLLGLTREALATRSGLPLMRLQAYEAGIRRVTPGDLIRLCQVLGASPATFLSGIPEPDHSLRAAQDLSPDAPDQA